MDPTLLHSFGWKALTEPTEVITRAAIDLYEPGEAART